MIMIMNKILKYFFLCFILLVAIGCKKTNVTSADNVIYEETIKNLKKDEPLLLTFQTTNSTEKVQWTILPLANTTINAVGNKATITFGTAGKYTVTATANDAKAIYNIEVNNTPFTDYGTSFNITASKQVNINENEPVVFSVHNTQVSGSRISWSVYPGTFNISKDTIKNTATITFVGSGTRTVSASDGINTQSRTIVINDRANANPEQDTVTFMLGDKLQLTPSVVSIGGSKRLTIQAATLFTYHCATDKILSNVSSFDLEINYMGVVIASQPCAGNSTASCSNNFSTIPTGSHPFTINYANKSYKGTIDVSNSGVFTFNWPNSSEVIISPLVVQ